MRPAATLCCNARVVTCSCGCKRYPSPALPLLGQSNADSSKPAPQSGKAEYKSVTVSLDATAEEFIDFYFDDPTRPTWVRALPGCTD